MTPQGSQKFPKVSVSSHIYELVQDFEAAWCAFCAADEKDLQAVGDAYATLSQRRKDLYHYISGLEYNAGIERLIRLRFD